MMPRNKVLWFGTAPQPEVITEFLNRELALEFVTQGNVDSHTLAQCRGVVYRFSPLTLTATRELFIGTWASATCHGLRLYLLSDNDTIQYHISEIVSVVKTELHRRTAPVPAHEIPEMMARYDPGPGYNNQVQIQFEGEHHILNPEEEVLLRRAFHDCKHVFLRPLTGGLSARVFCAYATFQDSIAGPRPLPFFVKIDERTKIIREKTNYELYARHFIPFNLRPNLDYRRCIMASELGVLVGNFVDRSESLWDVVRRGQAQTAIHSLFEDTLRGWRYQAFVPPETIIQKAVADGLHEFFNYRRVDPSHEAFAARYFGVSDTPIQLWEKLLGLQNQRFREAPMHGDLHGNNVRVRGNDAIVIDLASITKGPLVADLAALETSLAFDVLPGNDDQDADDKWKDIVEKLYAPRAFANVPPPETEATELAWLWNCVRQIRTMVGPIQVCETEYQTAVAIYLLRRTMYPASNKSDTFRRGYAYVLAVGLIADLNQKEQGKCVPTV
jgi:phosphotransferase family enzyme